MAQCKNCWICKKTSCEYYNSIDTNNEVDSGSWSHYGKTNFGNANNTKKKGGKRPSNSPKGFF